MKMELSRIKSILGATISGKDLFLSVIRKDGTIINANARMAKKIKLKPSQKGKANFFDFVHPLNVSDFKEAIENSVARLEPANAEIYIRNGYYHPMKWQINYLPESSTGGKYFCLGHKISEKETLQDVIMPEPTQAEVVSEITTDLFHSFFNHVSNLAWIIDKEANLVLANSAFFRYFNLEGQKSVGKNIQELISENTGCLFSEKHREVIQSGNPIEITERMGMKNGADFNFRINIFPLHCSGNEKMFGGYAMNIEEKYAAEKRLEEINERVLLLTRATTDAIWEWDMQTGYIFRNDILMDMIGYHLDKPKGLSWWLRRIHPDDRNRISDKVKDSTDRNEHSWEEEYRFKCADGTYKQMRDKGFIVYENGLPVKMVGSIQDISNLKDLENQLTKEKLQKQKELSETMIKAQEAERTRIGYELHDNVNQILSSTKLFVDMLTPANKKEKEAKNKSLDYIILAIDEIRKLSKELVVPHLKENGLIESIQSLIDDLHVSTKIKVKFTYDLDHELLNSAIKLKLFRIVQEQLRNITKHSRATKVDIVLQKKYENTQLIIKDNGIGFNPEETSRGVGLSGIFERTRFYNGTSEVKSSPGNGCTLFIEIPFLKE